jgi:hypothetical protein
MAPLVSTLGDLATVPALVLAAAVAGRSGVTGLVGAVSVVVASLSLVAAWRSRREQVRTIVRSRYPCWELRPSWT